MYRSLRASAVYSIAKQRFLWRHVGQCQSAHAAAWNVLVTRTKSYTTTTSIGGVLFVSLPAAGVWSEQGTLE